MGSEKSKEPLLDELMFISDWSQAHDAPEILAASERCLKILEGIE